MPQDFLDILACPVCKGPLVREDGRPSFACVRCALAFPVQDGVAFLTEAAAKPLTPQECESLRRKRP